MKAFSAFSVGSLQLKNRYVMAPMLTNYATDEMTVSEIQKEYYLKRARGGVALIIVAACAVNYAARISDNALGIYNDSFIPNLSNFVDLIHSAGAKVCLQLMHSIRMIEKKPADLGRKEIWAIIEEFVAGARRCKEAGFDAVEFQMAHSHTLADFLSRRGNTRTDEFGHGLEGRLRIAADIIRISRESNGDDFPIFCRINGDEFIVGGNTLKDAKIIAQQLERLGASAIDISAGGRFEDGGPEGYSRLRCWPTNDMPEATNVYLAAEIKKVLGIPVVIAGKIGYPDIPDEIIQNGKADLVALGRQLLADHDYVKKVQEGHINDILFCTYCNCCLQQIHKRKPISCVASRKLSSHLN